MLSLTRRGEQYVGRILALDEPVVNGTGRVRVGDSYWRVQGKDMVEGSSIKTGAVDGSMLVVASASG